MNSFSDKGHRLSLKGELWATLESYFTNISFAFEFEHFLTTEFYNNWYKSIIKLMEHYNSDIFCVLIGTKILLPLALEIVDK